MNDAQKLAIKHGLPVTKKDLFEMSDDEFADFVISLQDRIIKLEEKNDNNN